jgi:hypothetical protein
MEVHHHSHHPKKWKEYISEFLMLFFAVFLGFMSEYYLEYRAERHKEHDYLVSMVEDLKADTTEISMKASQMDEMVASGNKITEIIYKTNWTEKDIDTIYLKSIYMVTRFVNLNFTSGTIDQLKNAGGFRLIQNKSIVDRITDYEKQKTALKNQLDALMERWASVHRVQNSLLHLNVFKPNGQLGGIDYDREMLNQIKALTGSDFLISNRNTFYEYSNYINVSKGYVTFYKMMALTEKQKATELITIIEKELNH